MLKNLIAGSLALWVGIINSAHGEEAANLGRVMWSGYQCGIYAELAGKPKEQERLFNLAYNAGSRLLNGIKDKSIPESALKDAPIGITMRLGGPSIDFMIGRIFEGAMEDAYDSIVKTDSNGLTIFDPNKWNSDDELKRSIAKNKYSASNCEILR